MQKSQKRKNLFRRIISIILALVMSVTGGKLVNFTKEVSADAGTITLYFIDNTEGNWVKNDDAVIQLVDNTNGHDYYDMIKVDNKTWSVTVPKSAYNITFNRLNSSKSIQWNSWSAGGRDSHNTYYADGAEYGHWEGDIVVREENYFHAGDVIYLDVSEFTAWENDNALMYANFSDASKVENGGNDINISSADKKIYNPKTVEIELADYIYAYVVTLEDEGAAKLRFWRGNSTTLWNCSIVLSYEDYVNGINCVKINNWNDTGKLITSEYSVDIKQDSDGDGLPDYYELIYGLDKNSIDSDNDGLTDAQEIYFTNSNPAKYDSLIEGVSDANVDNDNDGLTNGEEISIGTNPNLEDSDEDGLTDRYEIEVTFSDPNNSDTDGDTLTDGDDVALGFSPLIADTDENGILDCDEKSYQSISVTIKNDKKSEISSVQVSFEGTGYINSTTSVEDLYEKDIFVSDTVGLVGVPVEIKSTSEFDNATVCFCINEKLNDIDLSDLIVVWYDEENDRYIEQETVVDETNKTVSTEVNHFSKYMLVDKTEWFEAWRTEINYSSDSDNAYETVIAIDCSGSMQSNDADFEYIVKNTLYPGSSYSIITCYRKLAAENFVEAQKSNDKTGIVLFDSTATIACGLTNSISELKSAIERIYSDGGTSFDSAISTSLNMLINSAGTSEKMILLVSDGLSSINNSVIETAKENGIIINTVYIGGSSDNILLNEIAAQTGGEYFKAVTADELIDIYSQIAINQKIDSRDSDNDGLPDIFEMSGMRLSNGEIIYTDPTNPDSDGDGLLDGEEIDITPTFWLNTIFDELNLPISTSAYIFEMYSNPNKMDSDDDGLLDGSAVMNGTQKIAPKDTQPLISNGLRGLWQEQIRQIQSGTRVAHRLDSWYDYDPNISWDIREWNWSEMATGIGSRILQFKSDEKNIAVHSQFDTWQSFWGYNDLYDLAFHTGTGGNMEKIKYEFSCDGEQYVIWAWRGDYLNLGSGAEIGIYTNPKAYPVPYTPLRFEQWEVDKDCALSMKLYLYNYYSSVDIDNIFCWEPYEPQWWITGFNPSFNEPRVGDMVSIGVIDFEEDTEMYNKLKQSVSSNENKKYLIFDEDGHTVWFVWGNY